MFIEGLIARDFSNDVTSTAQSFRSWDTCMHNTACKVIAIVGIVLAVLVAFWLIATFVRCCCMGVSCLEALCCCCCRSANTTYVEKPIQHPYENPNMYGPTTPPMYRNAPPPPTSQPQQAYFTSNQGYQPVQQDSHQSRYIPDEGPFGDSKNTYASQPYSGHNF